MTVLLPREARFVPTTEILTPLVKHLAWVAVPPDTVTGSAPRDDQLTCAAASAAVVSHHAEPAINRRAGRDPVSACTRPGIFS